MEDTIILSLLGTQTRMFFHNMIPVFPAPLREIFTIFRGEVGELFPPTEEELFISNRLLLGEEE